MNNPSSMRALGSMCTRLARLIIVVACLWTASNGAAEEIVIPDSGALMVKETDLAVPAGAASLVLQRWLRRTPGEPGMLGSAWVSSWETRLAAAEDGYTLSEGLLSIPFRPVAGSEALRGPTGAKLRLQEDGGAVLERADGERLTFDVRGRLHERRDRNGNRVRLRYDSAGRLTEVHGPYQARLRFRYDSENRLERVEGSNGRAAYYRFQNGGLVEVGNAEGCVDRYGYDEAGRLRLSEQAYGGRVEYRLDARGRVLERRRASGDSERWEYDDAARTTRWTNRYGGVTVWKRSADGRREEVIDPPGHKALLEYGANGELTRATGPTGLTASFTYDRLGRLTSATEPGGSITKLHYLGDTPFAVKVQPREGASLSAAYDSGGNLTELSVGEIRVARLSYYADGLPKTIAELGKGARQLGYDEQGRLRTIRDQLGYTSRFDYDARGNPTREVNPLGGVTTHDYDEHGRLTETVAPDGSVTRYEYDELGRRARVIESSGATRCWRYDPQGNRSACDAAISDTKPAPGTETVVRADGTRETLRFDALGQLVEHSDPLGLVTAYVYDALGRVLVERAPSGLETRYRYDDAGRPLRIESQVGQPLSLGWDAAGRLASLADAAGASIELEYDDLGRLLGLKDALGHQTRYRYGPTGGLTEVVTPSGSRARFGYDAEGRLQSIHYPGGGRALLEHDAMGNPLRIVDRSGARTGFDYDKAGNLTAVTHADGTITRFEASEDEIKTLLADGSTITERYTADGLPARIDDGSFPVELEYDGRGNPIRVTYPAIGKSVRYEYRADGLRAAVIGSDGRRIEYGYDELKRLDRITLPGGDSLRLTYDRADRVRSLHYPNGIVGEWRYNDRGELQAVRYRYASGRLLTGWQYRYDAAGNPIQASASGSAPRGYVYDPDGRLVEETVPGGTLRYRYNADGDRISRETEHGEATAYRYDAAGRLEHAGSERLHHDSRGRVILREGPSGRVSYEWDSSGNLTRAKTPAGAVEFGYAPTGERISRRDAEGLSWFLYDGLNLLEELDEQGRVKAFYVHGPGIDWPLAVLRGGRSYYYHADALGSVGNITDAKWRPAAAYRTDAFGRLTARSGDLDNPFIFAGRAYEPALGLYYFRARWYDPDLGRFLSPDPAAGEPSDPASLNRYAFARNAPTRYGDPLGLEEIDYAYWARRGFSREFIDRMVEYRMGYLTQAARAGKTFTTTLLSQAKDDVDQAMYFARYLHGRASTQLRSVIWQLSPAGHKSGKLLPPTPPKGGVPLTKGWSQVQEPKGLWERLSGGLRSMWQRKPPTGERGGGSFVRRDTPRVSQIRAANRLEAGKWLKGRFSAASSAAAVPPSTRSIMGAGLVGAAVSGAVGGIGCAATGGDLTECGDAALRSASASLVYATGLAVTTAAVTKVAGAAAGAKWAAALGGWQLAVAGVGVYFAAQQAGAWVGGKGQIKIGARGAAPGGHEPTARIEARAKRLGIADIDQLEQAIARLEQVHASSRGEFNTLQRKATLLEPGGAGEDADGPKSAAHNLEALITALEALHNRVDLGAACYRFAGATEDVADVRGQLDELARIAEAVERTEQDALAAINQARGEDKLLTAILAIEEAVQAVAAEIQRAVPVDARVEAALKEMPTRSDEVRSGLKALSSIQAQAPTFARLAKDLRDQADAVYTLGSLVEDRFRALGESRRELGTVLRLRRQGASEEQLARLQSLSQRLIDVTPPADLAAVIASANTKVREARARAVKALQAYRDIRGQWLATKEADCGEELAQRLAEWEQTVVDLDTERHALLKAMAETGPSLKLVFDLASRELSPRLQDRLREEQRIRDEVGKLTKEKRALQRSADSGRKQELEKQIGQLQAVKQESETSTRQLEQAGKRLKAIDSNLSLLDETLVTPGGTGK